MRKIPNNNSIAHFKWKMAYKINCHWSGSKFIINWKLFKQFGSGSCGTREVEVVVHIKNIITTNKIQVWTEIKIKCANNLNIIKMLPLYYIIIVIIIIIVVSMCLTSRLNANINNFTVNYLTRIFQHEWKERERARASKETHNLSTQI